MKIKYLVPILLLSIAAFIGWVVTQNNTPKTTSVSQTSIVFMKEDTVAPETLTIKKGTTVIFKNEDKVPRWPASNLHPTHTIYPEFDPLKPIEPGQQWQFTFEKAGEWKHHDHLLPSIRGVIIVSE